MDQKESDQLSRRLKAITGDLKLYIEKRVELLLLNIGEHFSRIMAESMQKTMGIVLLAGAVVFLAVASAIYLGELLGSRSLGYVIVALPLLVVGMLFVYLKPQSVRRKLQEHFEGEIVKSLSPNGEDEKPALPESETREKEGQE